MFLEGSEFYSAFNSITKDMNKIKNLVSSGLLSIKARQMNKLFNERDFRSIAEILEKKKLYSTFKIDNVPLLFCVLELEKDEREKAWESMKRYSFLRELVNDINNQVNI